MASDENRPTSPSEESKRKFLAAIEQKKKQGANRTGARESASGVHGVQSRAGGKREFRRKSGS